MHPKDRQFKVMGGHVDHDVCDYIATMCSEQNLDIHVGCDSQNYKRYTVYVTTVVFRYPDNGARTSSIDGNASRKSRTYGPSSGERRSDRWPWPI